MSLDVYLYGPPVQQTCICQYCDHSHQISQDPCLYSANITHNLANMAHHAGVYRHLWRPEEIGVIFAVQLIEPLRTAHARLLLNPQKYQEFDAPNGWGRHEQLVGFIAEYATACEEYPDALVKTRR